MKVNLILFCLPQCHFRANIIKPLSRLYEVPHHINIEMEKRGEMNYKLTAFFTQKSRNCERDK